MMDTAQPLAGKRVLFIAPMFFGYEKLIKEELECKGAIVDYYNDRPDNNFLTKALIRVDRRLLAHKTNTYYKNIIQGNKNKVYDHILIVRGEAISRQMLKQLRQSQPKARLSLYLWDSMHYNPNAQIILNDFDKIYSFDRIDTSNNPCMTFLPLFYAHEFERATRTQAQHIYDACFIGTIHTDRYKILEKIIDYLTNNDKKIFVFCYYPSKILFKLRCIVDPGFRRFGKKYINFVGMPLSDVVDRISESRAVIDINRPNQLGLTMRTIEAVGAQRILITTNEDIKNYDIYNPTGVLVADRENPIFDLSLLCNRKAPFDIDLRKKYSVSSWINEIFLYHA